MLFEQTSKHVETKMECGRKLRGHNKAGPRTDLTPQVFVPEIDEKGKPVDERFRSAAQENAALFYSHRRRELRDPAQIAKLIDQSAFEASALSRVQNIRNPFGLLWDIYRKLAGHEIERENRIQTAESAYLENKAGASQRGSIDEIERRIRIREVLEQADQRFREICVLRKEGHTMEEIGTILGISTSNVYTCFHRGKKKVLENNDVDR